MSPAEVRCRCGAINDVSFTSCIRCGQPLAGGRPAAAPKTAQAGVGTSVLLLGGLCAVVFALQLVLELKAGNGISVLGSSSLVALRVGSLYPTADMLREEPFRLLSAVYVHFGLLHFGLNMLGLYSQGRLADRILGPSRTLIAFVVGGVVGFAATCVVQAFSHGPVSATAGASGGLLAVMGMILGVMRRRKMPGFATQAGNVFFYVILFGLAWNAARTSIMINNSAHIGGLLCGFVLGYVWGNARDAGGPVLRGTAIVLFLASIASIGLALSSDLYKLVGAQVG